MSGDVTPAKGTAVPRDNSEKSMPAESLPPGAVRRLGRYAVGNRDGDLFAVSRVCRHQFADLSKGSIDKNGCLVCPWHGSRYDVTDGRMVAGPKGFLGYHGKTPGYTQLVRGYSKILRLKVGRLIRRGDRVVLD
jgi:3-phenylpropionate/trans-cinnamate dioxygenase ferredoxin component